MYVAFGWLITLTLAMWLGLCCIDVYQTVYMRCNLFSSPATSNNISAFENEATIIEKDAVTYSVKQNYTQPEIVILHYIMFMAGASLVLLYNSKTSLIIYLREKFDKVAETLQKSGKFKITVCYLGVAMCYYWNILWKTMLYYLSTAVKWQEEENINLLFLNRLKNLVQNRKTLSRLLTAAINENKSIRRLYLLETIAKKRLLCYIQDIQKLMKENRSLYVDFQQLNFYTERENRLLKTNIEILREERDEAQRKLLEIINVIYKSENKDLKAHCTHFIVNPKSNLLNSDVSAEIKKFLLKSNKPVIHPLNDPSDNISLYVSRPWTFSTFCGISNDDRYFKYFVSGRPNPLRGLLGEYISTVKDKNGIIEMLYEYNCEIDCNNGHTIRRVREYTVFNDNNYPQDSQDHRNLAEVIPTCPSLSASATRIRLDIKFITNHGFSSKVPSKKNNFPPQKMYYRDPYVNLGFINI